MEEAIVAEDVTKDLGIKAVGPISLRLRAPHMHIKCLRELDTSLAAFFMSTVIHVKLVITPQKKEILPFVCHYTTSPCLVLEELLDFQGND